VSRRRRISLTHAKELIALPLATHCSPKKRAIGAAIVLACIAIGAAAIGAM
jgi:hypothetical protein